MPKGTRGGGGHVNASPKHNGTHTWLAMIHQQQFLSSSNTHHTTHKHTHKHTHTHTHPLPAAPPVAAAPSKAAPQVAQVKHSECQVRPLDETGISITGCRHEAHAGARLQRKQGRWSERRVG